MDKKVIIVSFVGREKYLEIQKKYIHKLLSRNDCEWHLWNFSRNEGDNQYLQRLASESEDIKIFNQYYDGDNSGSKECIKKEGVICACVKCRVGRWTEPYKYYARRPEYSECLFLKIDDDILFLDTNKFDGFVRAGRNLTEKILSAYVVNNGLVAMIDPLISDSLGVDVLESVEKPRNAFVNKIRTSSIFSLITGRNIRAVNWWRLCTSVDFFRFSHKFFFDNFQYLKEIPEKIVPLPRSRFSINTILFNWKLMKSICEKIGSESSMNDEAIISENFNIDVYTGFVTSHLHFADQRALITDEEETFLLEKYALFAAQYLKLAVG